MVTASNGFLQLFSLDKNYFEYALTTEQLKLKDGNTFSKVNMKMKICIKMLIKIVKALAVKRKQVEEYSVREM